MKKTLLITGALVAWTASLASAAGISLNWGDCSVSGVENRNFACNINTGNHDLYISVDPPPSVTATNGHNHIIDLQSLSPTLPPWWDMNNTAPLACRGTTMSGSADFSASTSGGTDCTDTWNAAGNGSIAGYNEKIWGVPNRVRVVGTVSSADPVAMSQGTEYYSLRVRINSLRTVGTGACAGCKEPVCLVLNLVRIAQIPGTPGGDIEVTNPMVGHRNWVTWQGGRVGGAGCPGAIPTNNTAWRKVKSLQR